MKVILLGDSITQGLGSKKINFQQELQDRLSDHDIVLNYAKTGTTIEYINDIWDNIQDEVPDIAILLYGNVDAMLKPNRKGKTFRHLPKRFRAESGAMLLPRPFYSKKWYKKLFQKIDNLLRSVFRRYVIHVDGYEQWLQLDGYMRYLDYVCDKLSSIGTVVIICSTVYIDDRLFKGSDNEYKKYNLSMEEYATANNIQFVDLYIILKTLVKNEGWRKYYNYDNFHPNGNGYVVIATELAKAIRNSENFFGKR